MSFITLIWEGRPADSSLYQTRSSHGDESAEGYSVENLTASYVHLHFDACPQVPRSLVEKAAAFRRQRQRGAEMRPPDNARPRLIIRVPVGFVDAAEFKQGWTRLL